MLSAGSGAGGRPAAVAGGVCSAAGGAKPVSSAGRVRAGRSRRVRRAGRLRGPGAPSDAETGNENLSRPLLGCPRWSQRVSDMRVSAGMEHPATRGGKKWGQTFLNKNCLHTSGIQTLKQ